MIYCVLAVLCVFLMVMRTYRLVDGPIDGIELQTLALSATLALFPPVGVIIIIAILLDSEEARRTIVYKILRWLTKERHWRRSDPVEIKGFFRHNPDGVPKIITNEEMLFLTNNYHRKLDMLRGKFLKRESDGLWSAADNSTHECWTESFETFEEALAFLNGKEVD